MKNNLIFYISSIIALLFFNGCKTNHYNEVSHKSKNENTYISKYKFKEPYTYKTPVSISEHRLNQSKENSTVDNNINASTNDIIIVENKKYNNVPETENIVDIDLTLNEKKEIEKSYRKLTTKFKKVNLFSFLGMIASLILIFYGALVVLVGIAFSAGNLIFLGILLAILGMGLLIKCLE